MSTNWPRRVQGVPQCRALVVGIAGEENASSNASDDPLRTCEDIKSITTLLIKQCGYPKENIIVMTDSPNTPKDLQPKRANLKRQLRRLVKDARPGDRHFLFYAGHGLQRECQEDSDESDGMDECIKCADGRPLVDNWLKKEVVDPLPAGASLFALFDACHSGTMLDLPHRRCNESCSIAMALHATTRLARSLSSLPASVSSLSSPYASPSLRAQELPQSPSRSPLMLPDELAPPHSASTGSLSLPPGSPFFSSPSSTTSALPTTPLLLSSPLPPQSTISGESSEWDAQELRALHDLTLEIPLSPSASSKRKYLGDYDDEDKDEKCDGDCSPVTHGVPLVVSLASTADDELSFENNSGGPMTRAFVEAVRDAGGHLTYENLMLRLRDRFADLNQERYITVHQYRGSISNPETYEKVQRPQLCSLHPLDMDNLVMF